jgi:hypothetical protein
VALTWSPKQAATGAMLVLSFPNSPIVHQAVRADPTLAPVLDLLIEKRIRWHFIDVSIEEVLGIARAYDASGQENLAEMWLHGLSGESAELFNLHQPLITEPDMRAVLHVAAVDDRSDWPFKYLDRWDEVRLELRALIDNPFVRMAAMSSGERRHVTGFDPDRPTPALDSTALRRQGLGFVADLEEQTAEVNRRVLGAFPSLRDHLD